MFDTITLEEIQNKIEEYQKNIRVLYYILLHDEPDNDARNNINSDIRKFEEFISLYQNNLRKKLREEFSVI